MREIDGCHEQHSGQSGQFYVIRLGSGPTLAGMLLTGVQAGVSPGLPTTNLINSQ